MPAFLKFKHFEILFKGREREFFPLFNQVHGPCKKIPILLSKIFFLSKEWKKLSEEICLHFSFSAHENLQLWKTFSWSLIVRLFIHFLSSSYEKSHRKDNESHFKLFLSVDGLIWGDKKKEKLASQIINGIWVIKKKLRTVTS